MERSAPAPQAAMRKNRARGFVSRSRSSLGSRAMSA
jgi:hypothetical protein